MRKARRSRAVRLVTLLAACLTFATAFGLHPEPGMTFGDAPWPVRAQLPGPVAGDSTGDDCLACRAHRPLVSTPFLAVVPAPACSEPRRFVSRPSIVAEFEPSRPDGRAPPGLA